MCPALVYIRPAPNLQPRNFKSAIQDLDGAAAFGHQKIEYSKWIEYILWKIA